MIRFVVTVLCCLTFMNFPRGWPQFVFQFYKSGVITDDSCGARGDIDHGVLGTALARFCGQLLLWYINSFRFIISLVACVAVGHGIDPETQEPYFLVKNSWGEKWGDKG